MVEKTTESVITENEETSDARKMSSTKKKTSSKVKKPPTESRNPPTAEMVKEAIETLQDKGGSSFQAIKGYIGSNYKVNIEKTAPFIKKYLKSAVSSGVLVQTKGKGASGSFVIASSKISATRSNRNPGKTAKEDKTASKAAKKPQVRKKTSAAKKPEVEKKPAKKRTAAVASSQKKKSAKNSIVKKTKTETKSKTPVKKAQVKKVAKKSVAKKARK